jgi:6-phosphogluconolactonase
MAAIAPDIRIFTDAESLGQAAATLLTETARAAIGQRGRCLVSLSGGNTPNRMYAILAQTPQRDLVDWKRVHFFWGDERCVPPEDLNSNYHTAREMLLGQIPVPHENIHRVRTELGPELAAQDYALTLGRNAEPPHRWPRFDLVLLGLGEDGHTASLFPQRSVEDGLATVAVDVEEANPSGWRVSLTPAVFNFARRIVFMVQGTGKAAAVASVLYGVHDPERLPAQLIRPTQGELIWLLDAGAAAG